MLVELFLVEEFDKAAIGVALTLANAKCRMVLDMTEVRCELFWELYVIRNLLREGSQLTMRNGVRLV
jgi:hypothetical protein